MKMKKRNGITSSKEHPWDNACLNFTSDLWGPYVAGYIRATEIISEYVLDKQVEQDILVYPLLFLFRHCLEISMKSIISSGSRIIGTSASSLHTHDLLSTWKDCKAVLGKLWPDRDSARIMELCDEVIKQASILDSGSFNFRYPLDKAGKITLEGYRHINIRQFTENVGEVVYFLDGAVLGISEYRNFDDTRLNSET